MNTEIDEACAYVKAAAEPHGMEEMCLEDFERYLAEGDKPMDAAWRAVYDLEIK